MLEKYPQLTRILYHMRYDSRIDASIVQVTNGNINRIALVLIYSNDLNIQITANGTSFTILPKFHNDYTTTEIKKFIIEQLNESGLYIRSNMRLLTSNDTEEFKILSQLLNDLANW